MANERHLGGQPGKLSRRGVRNPTPIDPSGPGATSLRFRSQRNHWPPARTFDEQGKGDGVAVGIVGKHAVRLVADDVVWLVSLLAVPFIAALAAGLL